MRCNRGWRLGPGSGPSGRLSHGSDEALRGGAATATVTVAAPRPGLRRPRGIGLIALGPYTLPLFRVYCAVIKRWNWMGAVKD